MKKLLLIPLMIVLVSGLIFGGCAEPAPTPTPTPAPTPTPTPAPTPEEPIELIMASWQPMTMPPPIDVDPQFQIFDVWMDTIEEESGGRVHFTRYPGESLVPAPNTWEAVKSGLCDVEFMMTTFAPGEFPMTSAMLLPGLYSESSMVGSMILQRIFEDGYTATEWKDVKVLWFWTNPPQSVGCSVKQIRKLEDWEGLKVAVLGEPETSMMEAVGAVPVGIPIFEQYIALERGTVDAVIIEFNGQVAFKFFEVAPFQTFGGGGGRPCPFVMNLDTWNSLPADIQEIIDKNSGMLWSALNGQLFDACYQEAVAYMTEQGSAPYYAPAGEMARWQATWEPVVEAYVDDLEAQGLPGQRMLDRIRELAELYAKYER